MRRIVITCALLALLLPAVAAARLRAPGDGSLTVKNGVGYVQIIARNGGVIGRFDQGVLLVKDPNPNDDLQEVVTGAERIHPVNEFWTRYAGKNVRFRYIGGPFTIRITGAGIDLSAIGKGVVTLKGAGTGDDGTYKFNDDSPQPFPPFERPFQLGAPIAGP